MWEADTIDGFAPAPPPPPTPPTVSAPTVVVVSTGAGTGDGTPPTSPSASYKVTWKGTVGTSGKITHYDAWYQIDGGALKVVKLAAATSTTFTLSAHLGHHYRIAVRARTRTITGAVRYGTPFLPAQS